ncbi:GNAT family N-acetyltransferase [Hazenella sp. IB182357]|uniref:GNAT family N-acetyltransferase n=1 Tax=Polycladospora coralii TaxID=2771432 RepID=A0A926N8P5_9BACL|nr:GNAT family protein [Polycladospora coralii]MBD1371723.1 GNAT family N-acetyltransferase [Polycladospora coralii]MBS7529190.1 GNAT family N-acetyltransferase [Polycladospora coralii]
MTLYKSLFHGDKVRLAPFQADDAEQMSKWFSDAQFLREIDTDMAVPVTIHELENKDRTGMKDHNGIQFRIRTLNDDRLVGFIALHSFEWNNQVALIAIGIGEGSERDQGYGTDAMRLILKYAFHELNLNRVGLDVISYNARALKVYKKVGFKEEGRMRSAVLRNGNAYDRIIMGILKEEWTHKQKSLS